MTTVSGVVGGAVAHAVGAAGRLTGRRPLHPRGEVLVGVLRLGRDPLAPGALAPWTGPAVVRVSRGGGLPPGWPDVHALAIRWRPDDRPQDLLLSGTGLGPVRRFVLAPRLSLESGAVSTLMPFRTSDGPVVIAALARRTPEGGLEVRLASARGAGAWHPWGSMSCPPSGAGPSGAPAPDDPSLRFDPVLHCPDGLETYAWTRRLRLPAYLEARRAVPSPESGGRP